MQRSTSVLTIDDNQLVRRAFASFLGERGYRVAEAFDGPSGLAAVDSDPPDLVLLDLRMPGMDGLEVLSVLHRRHPELPVIVVSGADDVDDAIQALKRGAWDFLTKPIDDAALLETAVGRATERARLMRENREYQERIERTLDQLRRDQEAGRALQTQLLPPADGALDGYGFSRRLFPSAILSGDFVDYFRLDQRRLGFYIADVAGHGAASAFVTVMLKTLMRQYQQALGDDGDDVILCPARTLGRLNEDLHRHRVDKHVTMFYGVIDTVRETLAFANAAHYPYPLVRVRGEVVAIEKPGKPVGLFPQVAFERHELPVAEGFTMLLASDGVLELLPTDDEGRIDARDAALSAPLQTGTDDLDALAQGLGVQAGASLHDDVALLLIRGPSARRGEDGPHG